MTQDQFLKDVSSWSNHRHLLWPALEATKGSKFPVLELGCGNGSTPFLQQYCRESGRELVSLDNNREWAEKFGAIWMPTWNLNQWFYKKQYSVVLVDEAPGEHRKEVLALFAAHPIHFQIIVVHDSEPAGWNASDYQVRPVFGKFKFVQDYKEEQPGPWATWLSNTYDITDTPE